jgi:predicted phosphoadenosine phosphosulfate sulfurtransferase
MLISFGFFDFMFGAEFIMAEKLTWLCYKILSTATDIDNRCKQSLSHYARQRFRRNFLLQNDNAPPHRAGVVQNFLYYDILPIVMWQVHQDLIVERRDFLQLGREHPTHAL